MHFRLHMDSRRGPVLYERIVCSAAQPHGPFPVGRLFRMPALVLAMLWYQLRDLL